MQRRAPLFIFRGVQRRDLPPLISPRDADEEEVDYGDITQLRGLPQRLGEESCPFVVLENFLFVLFDQLLQAERVAFRDEASNGSREVLQVRERGSAAS